MAFLPPVVSESKPLAVSELLTVSFWFAPVAVLAKEPFGVPELVQVTRLGWWARRDEFAPPLENSPRA